MKWYLIDQTPTLSWIQLLNVDTIEEAIAEGMKAWDKLSPDEKEKRQNFYVCQGDESKTSMIDFDTMHNEVDIKKLLKKED